MINHKQLFYKASSSAMIGLPIGIALNLTIIPLFIPLLVKNPYLYTLMLSAPYVVAAILRLYLIDYIWLKYSIDINPTSLIKKGLNKIRHFK